MPIFLILDIYKIDTSMNRNEILNRISKLMNNSDGGRGFR